MEFCFAVRMRMFPSHRQEQILWKNLNASRFIYNQLLANSYTDSAINKLNKLYPIPKNYWKYRTVKGKKVVIAKSKKRAVGLDRITADRYPWLGDKDLDSMMFFNTGLHYQSAWQMFRKVHRSGVPKFKRKDRSVQSIIENDLPDLKAAILQDQDVKNGIAANVDAEVMNKELIPKVVMTRYPDLSNDEVDQVSQYVVADTVLRHAKVDSSVDQEGNTNEFLKMADKFINVNDLDINLIESINPFQRAYDVMSQNIDSDTLRIIERSIDAKKYDFSDEELMQLYMNAKVFVEKTGRKPDKNSNNEEEVRMAYALAKLSDMRARRNENR